MNGLLASPKTKYYVAHLTEAKLRSQRPLIIYLENGISSVSALPIHGPFCPIEICYAQNTPIIPPFHPVGEKQRVNPRGC
jgi:hypothetical protein